MRAFLLDLYWRRVLAAAALDALALGAGVALAWLRAAPLLRDPAGVLAAAVAAAAALAGSCAAGAFDLGALAGGRRGAAAACAAPVVLLLLAGAGWALGAAPEALAPALARAAAFALPLLLAGRLLMPALGALPPFRQRLLVVGTSELGVAIVRALQRYPGLGPRVVGFVSDERVHEGARLAGVPVLGRIHEVGKVAEREGANGIVVASTRRHDYFPADELLDLRLRGCRVEAGARFHERVTGRVALRDLRASYLLFGPGCREGLAARFVRRTVDIAVAVAAAVAASPLLALAAAALQLEAPGAVLARERCVGLGGRAFDLWRLRTRRPGREPQGGAPIGHLLRRTHLDALPQLWNLLRGDLTLVGPRPERSERFESLCALHPCFRLRASVAPGLTGWAQLRAGGAELGEEALSLDLYYLKHRSLTLDLLIVWASAARALRGGVSAS